MKKYLALALFGMMLVLVQPAFSQCGCPVTMNPCAACPTGAALPVYTTGSACPVAPTACPTCPPQVVYQPMLQPVAPVVQTVAEPVMSYQYRQIATCPNTCNPCGMAGAAAPIAGYPAAPIVYENDRGFWSDFFGFD